MSGLPNTRSLVDAGLMSVKIGLIGGMSWHSTIEYYRVINERIAAERGGHCSAPLMIDSLDFQQIRNCQLAEAWDDAGTRLADSARRLESAGASHVMIATNLMHKVAPAVEDAIDVPLLHIADAVAGVARDRGITTVGLIGTQWVMSETFYADRLAASGVRAISPAEADHAGIDQVIFDELTRGIVRPESREFYCRVVRDLVTGGAQAIVLACTEIELLISPDDCPVPVIDSMRSHAEAAARLILTDQPVAEVQLVGAR